jgi:molybdopterin-binding protein
MHAILYAVAAYLVGVFTPAVSRRVKSLFSKEGKAAVAAVKSEAVAVEKKL